MTTHSGPLIARYMESVAQLSPAARRQLDVDLWYPFRTWMWLVMPQVFGIMPYLALLSWITIRGATRSADREEQRGLELFFADLANRQWTLPGRAKVAGGLLMLRSRFREPATALRMYDKGIGRFVHRQAIGWMETPARVTCAVPE